jgi:restriction system protein
MAEITRRRQGEMLQGIVTILRDNPDGLSAQEALSRLEHRLSLTPYEQGTYDSGGRRFEKIARFSTVGAVKAGWMLKQKGRWMVTEEGRLALTGFPDPEALFRRADALYKSWRQSQPVDEADFEAEDGEDAGDAATVKLEEAIESAWGEVEQFIRSMNPYDFQDLVVNDRLKFPTSDRLKFPTR